MTRMTMKTITASELGADAGAAALVVDVRTPAEYESVHIPGSRLVPLHELDAGRLVEWLGDGRRCCLVCGTGKRAGMAAEKLAAAGIEDVVVLDGGVEAWQGAGLPVNRGRKALPLDRQMRIAAGLMVVAGVVLGVWVAPWWLVLSGFVGAGLVFAGVTDCCPMMSLLAKAPWNARGRAGGGCGEGSQAGGCCGR